MKALLRNHDEITAELSAVRSVLSNERKVKETSCAEHAEAIVKLNTELRSERAASRRLNAQLAALREKLGEERNLALSAQVDGERAVLRTIEGFVSAKFDKSGTGA